jgi:tRNA 5-methylaminomethyl-2-thiouridine biosynthesis bifunctional protein
MGGGVSYVGPVLDWEDGLPVSRLYGDRYFSRSGGLEEVQHVFLAGNRLAERFSALAGGRAFVVGELGFGTGLSFLGAWRLFERSAAAHARLHFVSTELHPLPPADLERALRAWPVLSSWRERLMRQYVALSHGWHRFAFDGGRVALTLLIGDARETLPALEGRVDAWFLDGFSPAKNPALWEPALFGALARHSRPGATLATYSCAGAVRGALTQAGFRVWKAKGFGAKREMLCGELAFAAAPLRSEPQRRAVVVGGGLAGCAAAGSLAQRGWQVTLLEREPALAAGASGNPQGVLYARLSAHHTPLGRLVLAGYQYTLRLLRERLACDREQWSDCPVLQLAFDDKEARRQQALLQAGLPPTLLRGADSAQASALAGIPLAHGGLVFPGGGWVHPPALCAALASHPRIAVLAGRDALRIDGADGGWRVSQGATTLVEAPVVVIAAAGASGRFAQAAHLPLRLNRGQLTLLPATAASGALRAVLCGQGYVAPARRGVHTAGATFARDRLGADAERPSAPDNAENLSMLAQLAPGFHAAVEADRLNPAGLAGRAALRCGSPDYLPLVGAVDEPLPGLTMSAAHGSRGLISAPLAGEVLACALEDEPAPLPADLVRALRPSRFGASPRVTA